MHFLHPEYLYMMLLPAFVLIYLVTTNKDAVERVFDEKVLERLRVGGDALGRTGHNLLLFFAFLFMALALAQPVIERGKVRIGNAELHLVVALDLSRSMLAKDFYPNRLGFAKQKLEELLEVLPFTDMGIVGFTRASFLVAPPTSDREALAFLLKRLGADTVTAEGTSLKAALEGAVRLLPESGEKVVLLVTDGGEEKEMAPLVKLAERKGAHVAVWMVATREGAPVEAGAPKPGGPVLSRANTRLKVLAAKTGGIYVEATPSQQDEASLRAWMEDLAEKARRSERVVHRRIQLFYYPLALALLVLPFALYSLGGRRVLSVLALWAVFARPVSIEAGVFDFLTIDRAYESYAAGDYNRSIALLERLARTTGKSEAWYDLGNAYYRAGRYEEACRAYANVITGSLRVERAKLYNMANCYVKLGDLQRAARLYRKVLESGEEPNARYNLSLVLEALKKRQEKSGEGKRREEGRQESREERKQRAGAASSRKGKRGKGGAKKGKKGELSPEEERKWMKLIRKQPLQTRLYPLTPPEEDDGAHPW